MIESVHLNAVGDTYRVGSVDYDGLYPAYSNAAIMHAVVPSLGGRRTGDANLAAERETWSRAFVELSIVTACFLNSTNPRQHENPHSMALWIWTLAVLNHAPLYKKPWAVAHVNDCQIDPLITILADYHEQSVDGRISCNLSPGA
ncbi:hypothetical protein DOTSEDRAFT_40122 [Dothistroma septosporum NZE10]|uniref:Uncharacterized protein n=1 Tax=Dothistroma septosporum (strain NZE10 / CBS 128990) TaxID=675120 RepID=N1Q0M9_DOTSN|nr:hypothetical protein DOTSEDRAFT_40122 [Dothistroma septosporum NZE10]